MAATSSALPSSPSTPIGGPIPGSSFSGDGAGGKAGDENPEGSASSSKKRPNPLVDLIETESAYVAELASIIKKVASAWSRHNFPPPELDTMFRNIEAVYRINRSFLKALHEIGPNPSSPKALGDLLMRWIDDLDGPYTRYCDNFFSNFDTWPTVQSNTKLAALLAEISRPPADGSTPVFSDRRRQPEEPWTIDSLFALPHLRLKYYKKLYARLLKSTQPGRSDHRLLVLANEKLDELLERSKNQTSVTVLDETPAVSVGRGSDTSFPGTNETAESASQDRLSSATSVSAGRASSSSANPEQFKRTSSSPQLQPQPAANGSSSSLGAPLPPLPTSPGHSSGPHSGSASTIVPMVGALNTSAPPAPSIRHIDELESRLDTTQTLDIFSMKPKQCQLHMNPPGLPFRRELRASADAIIYFTPTATGQEVVTRRAHIILLTDLFLMCERVGSAKDRAENAAPEKDMRLMFPPLGGKHVQVTDMAGTGNSLSLLIAKKETLTVMLESRDVKEAWIKEFERSKEFVANLNPSPAGQQARPGSGGSTGSGGLPPPPPAGTLPPPFPPVAAGSGPMGARGNGSPAQPFPPNVPPNPFANQQRPIPGRPPGPPTGPPGVPPGGPMGRGAMGPGPGVSGPGSPVNGIPARAVGPGGMGRGGPGGPGPMPGPPANGRLPGAVMPPPPRLPGGAPPGWTASAVSSPGSQSSASGPRPRQAGPTRHPSAPDMRAGNGGPGPGGLRAPLGANGGPPSPMNGPHRTRSVTSEGSTAPTLPSEMMKQGLSRASTRNDLSPPNSPPQGRQQLEGQSSVVAAQMRCRLFLKQNHAQWKALGNARLKLYHLMPSNDRQLVVENDKKRLISTLVLSDGVERVGKVGIAVELSDRGSRTGIVYMLQMRSEESAGGLFGLLLEGSDRSGR
ncbi:hypothetical protein OC846_003294 [Tilletia horrida]|uniref:DH domain-containing protein n=1 Tax=Tilletia horrida TaxID=155126 RepID=A0AAN6GSF6_9BASI|nr:hypothetical protein OC845_002545 [Tilletia horrida]KAK0551424.1 hypothetical protein OC846_003294 [Tilletia horrida]